MNNGKIIMFALFLLATVSCNSGKGSNAAMASVAAGDSLSPKVSFSEYEYDFGAVKSGQKLRHTFSFVNNGPGDLVISSTSTTCGCTVAEYDRKPIQPGKSGSLDVVFDTYGRSGKQTKTISVKSNARMPLVILKITADVN